MAPMPSSLMIDLAGDFTTRMNHMPRGPERPVIRADVGQKGNYIFPDWEQFEVQVHDVRDQAPMPTLNPNGMVLHDLPSAVGDFRNENELREIYEPELQALLQQQLGPLEILIFDHTVRVDDGGARQPARYAHGDYTPHSGLVRLADFVGNETAAEWNKGHFAIFQTWRPIAEPVQQSPLAFLDATSWADEDLILTTMVRPHRTGEIYQIGHNPDHRWLYVSAMRPDELVLFKTFDNTAKGRQSLSFHSAVNDPRAPDNAPPRQSIESRIFVRLA